ncbi:hypothetical protein H4R34_003190 [Dimargaris verticillata]|uniref:Uncharacterized protein n=1 Tax=Dimargaris verticillata TaxID=2761393 RepID=A0A9W8B2M1_9FUNG|nr:hypothetical protein H4R34_003190 [Dimargaris verticillata]
MPTVNQRPSRMPSPELVDVGGLEYRPAKRFRRTKSVTFSEQCTVFESNSAQPTTVPKRVPLRPAEPSTSPAVIPRPTRAKAPACVPVVRQNYASTTALSTLSIPWMAAQYRPTSTTRCKAASSSQDLAEWESLLFLAMDQHRLGARPASPAVQVFRVSNQACRLAHSASQSNLHSRRSLDGHLARRCVPILKKAHSDPTLVHAVRVSL